MSFLASPTCPNVVPKSRFNVCERARAGRKSRANRSCKFGSLSHERTKPRVASPSCRISRLDVATGGVQSRDLCSVLSFARPGPVFRRRGLFIDLLFCLFCRASECFGFGSVPVPRSALHFLIERYSSSSSWGTFLVVARVAR